MASLNSKCRFFLGHKKNQWRIEPVGRILRFRKVRLLRDFLVRDCDWKIPIAYWCRLS